MNEGDKEWGAAYPMRHGPANVAIERELAQDLARREIGRGYHKPHRSADALVGFYGIKHNRAYRIAPMYRKAFTEMYLALHPEAGFDDADRVAQFMKERCATDPEAWISIADLYRAYLNWTKGEYVLSLRKVVQYLLLNPSLTRSTQRVGRSTAKGIRGLRLVDPNEDLL